MAVPTDISDLSATTSSNSPAGTDSIGTDLDDYMRAIQAIIKQNVSKGADIASSTTITIPDVGGYFVVTGTTAITGINDTWNGRTVMLKFSGIVTLTNSAGLILGADITTAAGDVLILTNESTGVYRLVKGKEIIDNGGIIRGNLSIGDGTTGRRLDIRHDGTNAPAVRLLRNDGTAAGIIYTDPSTDVLILSQMDTDGTTVLSQLSLSDSLIASDSPVSITGTTTINGECIIQNPSPNATIKATAMAGLAVARIKDHAGIDRFHVTYDDGVGSVTITRLDAAGAAETILTFSADGNVSVNGATPTLDSDLTRKDFVVGLTDTLTANLSTLSDAVDLKAPISSPTFTDVPEAPTAISTTNTPQIATTAFVQSVVSQTWCNFDGTATGTNAPTAGNNVATVTRMSTGIYQITFTSAMASANYAPVGMGNATSLVGISLAGASSGAPTEKTTTVFRIEARNASSTLIDITDINIVVFGG